MSAPRDPGSEPHAPDLWAACRVGIAPGLVAGELLRLVESQEQVATTRLVDDLAEQSVLEDLLESAKPPRRPGTRGMHYPLATPFRYPHLRHGSRFGSHLEPGIFYGALGLTTALAEGAYYRLVFWTAMDTPPPSGRLLTQHSLYRARYRTEQGLRLQAPPCAGPESVLRHPTGTAGVGVFARLSLLVRLVTGLCEGADTVAAQSLADLHITPDTLSDGTDPRCLETELAVVLPFDLPSFRARRPDGFRVDLG